MIEISRDSWILRVWVESFTWASSGSGGAAEVPGKWGKNRGRSCVIVVDTGHWQTPTGSYSWRIECRLAVARCIATVTRRRRRRWYPQGTNHAAGQPDNWCRRIPTYRRKNNHPLYEGTDRRDRKGLNSRDSPQCRKRSVHAFLHKKQQNMSCKLRNETTQFGLKVWCVIVSIKIEFLNIWISGLGIIYVTVSLLSFSKFNLCQSDEHHYYWWN